jgi:hypothetical protein
VKDLPEKLAKQIFNFTSVEFSSIEIKEIIRSDGIYPGLLIAGADIPIVFVKTGTYAESDGTQKTAFMQGTVYFRHSDRSKPGDSGDLKRWRHHYFADLQAILVSTAVQPATEVGLKDATLQQTQSVGSVAVHNTDELWPYRRQELIRVINDRLPRGGKVVIHDIVCVNRMIDVLQKHPEFVAWPRRWAGPQYSPAYADWIIEQVKADPKFLEKCRDAYRRIAAARWVRLADVKLAQ